MTLLEVLALLGTAVGSGFFGSFFKGWMSARSARRTDAVESANAKQQVNMLADADRRAKEAEAEADELRVKFAAEQRERMLSDSAHKDAERDLRAARRDIARLRKRMKRDGVPDSEIADLIETALGDLDDNPKPAKPL